MTKSTHDMAWRHENWLAHRFTGRLTRGSGNQWDDQLDGKQPRGSGEVVFAWDGKSTTAASIMVTKDMWRKVVEQTRAWEVPMLALRFYADRRLERVELDLAVVEAWILASLQSDAAEVVELREEVERLREVVGALGDTESSEQEQEWRGQR